MIDLLMRRREMIDGRIDGEQIPVVRMPIGSYLDTGYYPNSNTKVECGFTPLRKAGWSIIFQGKTSDNLHQYSVQYYSPMTKLLVFNGNTNGNTLMIDLRPGTYYDLSFYQTTFILNGTTTTTTNFTTNYTSAGTLRVNGGYLDGSENIFNYFKVYDNGTLVRDYVPWKRSNGTVGMLDKVHNMFYESAVPSHPFNDNEPVLPQGYTRLNYITCNGTQRFFTSFIPHNLTDYRVKCRFAVGTFQFIFSSKASETSRRFELGGGSATKPQTELYFGYNNGSRNVTSISNYANLDMQMYKSDTSFWIYRNGVFVNRVDATRATFTCPTYLNVGCSAANGAAFTNYFSGDIVELDFFNSGRLIPCKSPNDVVGMYDVINNVFHSSESGTEFVAGTVYGET